jgi:hypothetical protein
MFYMSCPGKVRKTSGRDLHRCIGQDTPAKALARLLANCGPCEEWVHAVTGASEDTKATARTLKILKEQQQGCPEKVGCSLAR